MNSGLDFPCTPPRVAELRSSNAQQKGEPALRENKRILRTPQPDPTHNEMEPAMRENKHILLIPQPETRQQKL